MSVKRLAASPMLSFTTPMLIPNPLKDETSLTRTDKGFVVSQILDQDQIQNLKSNMKRELKVEKIDFDNLRQVTTIQLNQPIGDTDLPWIAQLLGGWS